MRGSIVSIVEGHGEVKALPALLYKLLEHFEASDVQVASPIRIPRGKLVSPGELERALELAQRRRKNAGAILVLIDADKDCPALIGSDLLKRARKAIHLPVAVVLAKKEFETWFLGCLERFRGFMGIPCDVSAPHRPEDLGGKGTLERFMGGVDYLPRIHQVDFVRKMEPEDLALCQKRCPSFKKLTRDVKFLLESMTESGGRCGS